MALARSGAARTLGRALGARGIATQSLPDLPYDYGALAPVIIPEVRGCGAAAAAAAHVHPRTCRPAPHPTHPPTQPHTQIMELHHKKHHQAYVNGLNAALEKEAEAAAKGDVAGLIAVQGAIKFNGGGHLNHSLFWQMLTPPKVSVGVRVHPGVPPELRPCA